MAELFSTFWIIFSFSFLVALTGAMAPGPLLTYTIVQSVKTGRRGYLAGLWVIVGHALLEMGIIVLLLLGFSFVLKNLVVFRLIGTAGAVILAFFGISIIRSVRRDDIPDRFWDFARQPESKTAGAGSAPLDNPVFGGVVISMSNPYWWIWWASIGLAFMIQFEISFQSWPRLLAFFAGHEAGDLAWYLLVSVLAFFGIRRLSKRAYYAILVCCGIFMVLFGLYLGVSTFIKDGV